MALYFISQERREACLPACLRMIFADFGIACTEAEIYDCCETTFDGTLPSAAVNCAITFGLNAAALRLQDIQELEQFVGQTASHAIVFVNLAPLLGQNVAHAVIVTDIDQAAAEIRVMDPAYPPNGKRTWALGQFQLGWQMARFQIIVIRTAEA